MRLLLERILTSWLMVRLYRTLRLLRQNVSHDTDENILCTHAGCIDSIES